MANQDRPQVPDLDLLSVQSMNDESLWRSLKTNLRDRLFPPKLPPLQLSSRPMTAREMAGSDLDFISAQATNDEPLLHSIFTNVRAALFPKKLPPLQLSSKPVPVRELWG